MTDTDITNSIHRVLQRDAVKNHLSNTSSYHYHLALTQLECQHYTAALHSATTALQLYMRDCDNSSTTLRRPQHVNYVCNVRFVMMIALLNTHSHQQNTTVIDLTDTIQPATSSTTQPLSGDTIHQINQLFADCVSDMQQLPTQQYSRPDIWLYVSHTLLHNYNIQQCLDLCQLNLTSNADAIDAMLYRLVLSVMNMNHPDSNLLLTMCHTLLQYTQSIDAQLLYVTVLLLCTDAYAECIQLCNEMLPMLGTSDVLSVVQQIQIHQLLALAYHRSVQYNNAARMYAETMVLLQRYSVPYDNIVSVSVHYDYAQFMMDVAMMEEDEGVVRDLLTAAKKVVLRLYELQPDCVGVCAALLEAVRLRCINHDGSKYTDDEVDEYYMLASTVYDTVRQLRPADLAPYYTYAVIAYIAGQYDRAIEVCDEAVSGADELAGKDSERYEVVLRLRELKLHSCKSKLLAGDMVGGRTLVL